MPFSPEIYEEKPYNRCLNCSHIGKNCDGPNFLAMDMHRLSEWCRLRKEYLHTLDPKWTNAFIAEQSMMSKVSVDRFLSGTVEDIKMSTVARIVRVLVNGSWGQYPCATGDLSEHETVYIDNPEIVRKAEESSAECKRLQTILDSMNQEHRADIAAAHTEDQRKIDFLKEQIKFQEDQLVAKDKLLDERRDFLVRKDRAIVTLSILFAIAMLIIIFALIVDRLNYDLGFFWRMASNFRTAWGLNGINI